jgi:hypothetical protein
MWESLMRWAEAHQARLEELANVLALLPFVALVGALIAVCEKQRAQSEVEWQQAIAGAQKWGDDCRASGGYVHQEKWVEEVPFRKKAQRYETHYRTYCMRPTAAPHTTPAIPLQSGKVPAKSQKTTSE